MNEHIYIYPVHSQKPIKNTIQYLMHTITVCNWNPVFYQKALISFQKQVLSGSSVFITKEGSSPPINSYPPIHAPYLWGPGAERIILWHPIWWIDVPPGTWPEYMYRNYLNNVPVLNNVPPRIMSQSWALNPYFSVQNWSKTPFLA